VPPGWHSPRSLSRAEWLGHIEVFMRGARLSGLGAVVILSLSLPPSASAFDRLCDPAFENCRTPLINLIRNETVGIDVGFWFMEDARYANELIARHRAGVPVRVVFDSRAFTSYGYPSARYPVELMRDAGIPMRNDNSGAIFHFKMMLFAGQNQVEFSGANYSASAFVPVSPYANYVDEAIVFIDDPAIVNSFKTRFDDVWTASTGFTNYANVTEPRARNYPTYPIDPELTFVPWNNFRSRSVGSYRAEPSSIDAIMYRITDRAHTDELIRALGRGVRVRLLSEQEEYRNPARLWHSWNVERLWMAGAEVKHRGHAGINHEKLTVLHGQRMIIVGSSNWTSASATGQHEHNLFTTRSWMYTWARDHFNRKWNNTGSAVESVPFVPQPPDAPRLRLPANGAGDQPLSVTLTWYAGPWSHKYDVFVGTNPGNLTKIVDDSELGPSEHSTDYVRWTVSGLAAGTTYYWKVVGRTMADVSRTSTTFSFRTASGAPAPAPSGWSGADVGAVGAAGNAGLSGGVFTVQGSGADVWGSADELYLLSQPLTGDGSITARVDSLTNNASWTKVGVMMRETTAANSKHAFMIVSPGKGLAFQRRRSTGGSSSHTSGGMFTAPYWVRLTRTGATIQAAVSADGTAWRVVGSDTIAMASTIRVGLAVSSHVDGDLATARFSNVSVGPGS
jgi:hypothetical protein